MSESNKGNPTITIYDFDPHNLPHEYLQAIGLLVAASSQTESCLQDLIGVLLGIDNIEVIALTSRMTMPLKDHVIRALIELNAGYANIIDDLDDLLDQINAAFAKRNTLVHNAFAIHPKTGEILSTRIKVEGSLQAELKPVSIKEIQEDAATIYELGLNIIRFMQRCGLEPIDRTRPLHLPLNRKKRARAERRDVAARGA